MTQRPGHPDPAIDPLSDPGFLLDLAAWVDGTLDADRRAAVEARLAADPRARALAASARLDPVVAGDLDPAVPFTAVAAATAAAAEERDAPLVTVERPGHPASRLLWPLAAAACLGAAFIGWHVGGVAGRPGAMTPAVAVDRPAAPDDGEDAALLVAASFGTFGLESDTNAFDFDVFGAITETEQLP